MNNQSFLKKIKQRIKKNKPDLALAILTLLFLIVYFSRDIFITIYPGEAGVLFHRFRGGTVTDRVYGEGLHAIFPWDAMYVYNVRIQEIGPSLTILSKDGLKLKLDLSIRFHPERELLGVLHKEVGPDYVKKVVIPETESILRTLLGRYTAEDFYTTKHDIIAEVVMGAFSEVVYRYTVVEDVIVRQITLPEQIRNSIEEKIQQKHLAESYVFRLEQARKEAERKRIEAKGYQVYNDTISTSLTPDILLWKGIEATRDISVSENTKVIIIGNGADGLPVILSAVDKVNPSGASGVVP